MRTVIARLGALLADPTPVIQASQVKAREPALQSELPCISVDLDLDHPTAVGLGRIGREGKQLVRAVEVVTVGSDPNFDAERRVWRIPEILARDPSGRGVEVAVDGQPLVETSEPQNADQFNVDLLRREVRFGAAQQIGRVLEIGYPTLAFSDDIRFERYSGILGLTLWAADPGRLDALFNNVLARFSSNRAALAGRGFLTMTPSALVPGSLHLFESGAGPSFRAWRARCEFRFAFEAEAIGEALSGGHIRKITTKLGGVSEPPLTVPAAP